MNFYLIIFNLKSFLNIYEKAWDKKCCFFFVIFNFISMIGMELSMNLTDVILTGGAMLTWWAIPIMLFVGFITPLPYNYYKLKKYNIGCH